MANHPVVGSEGGTDTVEGNLSHAAELQGMPHEGAETFATTEGGTGQHHAEPAVAGILDATVWVSLAMAVLFAIVLWKKVPALITRGLDRQIAEIKQRLDEAKQLRTEAEALRAEYAAKIAGAEKDAEAMLSHAREEAGELTAKAERDAGELVQRRTRMAEDKIAAAERQALAEVRAKAADAAAKAAAALIAERHNAVADKALVDRTIAGLNRPH